MDRTPRTLQRCRTRRADGFAVLITLGLLALLGLLLLALAAQTEVESRIADRTVRQAQARRNAVMALRIALGRVQRFAGPDSRVTATAEAFGGTAGTGYFTGVWDATAMGLQPLTWLVSGNEGPDSLAITPASNGESVELLGVHGSGVARDVTAPLQAITSLGWPRHEGPVVTGHYAWWVGDEGVKADVAIADRTDAIMLPPFDSPEARRRIRQQIALGAGPADSTGEAMFEPRDASNAALVAGSVVPSELQFLHRPDGAAFVGPDLVRAHAHEWTVGNFAVLAQTSPGGLRQDLSLKPGLLGAAFAAWSAYAGFMEDPSAPVLPAISPPYPDGAPRESIRRRYRLAAPLIDAGITQGVAPVVSYFLLTFNVRTDQSVGGVVRPLEVRARWLVSAWNPFTSALVPENLQLEVTGLPVISVFNDTAGVPVANVDLNPLFGGPLRISLPWQPAGRDDQSSWLPGRVYTWASQQDLNKAAPPPAPGFASEFYTRNLSTAAGQGVQRAVAFATVANSAQLHLTGSPSQLTVRLYRVLADGSRELLRTHLSPVFSAFATTPGPASASTYQVTLVFHLAESTDTPASPDVWLTTDGQDPREAVLPPESYFPGANGPRPELYPNYTSISFPDRLLDRALPASPSSTTGQSYNEDTPLFELPRGPLLSVGELQQVSLAGARPFAIGNSWGHAGHANQVFDRYFFSGLTPGAGVPDLAAGEVWPNSLLGLAGRKPDASLVTPADVGARVEDGYSSKYLLQRGAFNLNSVNPLAWLAVLRSGRVTAGNEFNYLAASPATGTQSDSATAQAAAGDVVFYRFPSSAQETFQADAGYAASNTVPPVPPSTPSSANTHLYRRGIRVLSMAQAVALANTIASLVRARHAAAGPFRTVEEFLEPAPEFGDVSLLERALADAVASDGGLINDPATVPEFSSQWLTQGDLLGILAPVLFCRSDTFLIRAYGDSVSPGNGATGGRAWCEARVQRLPEYFDSSQPAETPPDALNSNNQTFGRRFKVVYFRWLASREI